MLMKNSTFFVYRQIKCLTTKLQVLKRFNARRSGKVQPRLGALTDPITALGHYCKRIVCRELQTTELDGI